MAIQNWRVTIRPIGEATAWESQVTASSERQALRRGLTIFLTTQEREDVVFDFTSIEAERIEAGRITHR